eukprot:gene19261-25894_t
MVKTKQQAAPCVPWSHQDLVQASRQQVALDKVGSPSSASSSASASVSRARVGSVRVTRQADGSLNVNPRHRHRSTAYEGAVPIHPPQHPTLELATYSVASEPGSPSMEGVLTVEPAEPPCSPGKAPAQHLYRPGTAPVQPLYSPGAHSGPAMSTQRPTRPVSRLVPLSMLTPCSKILLFL